MKQKQQLVAKAVLTSLVVIAGMLLLLYGWRHFSSQAQKQAGYVITRQLAEFAAERKRLPDSVEELCTWWINADKSTCSHEDVQTCVSQVRERMRFLWVNGSEWTDSQKFLFVDVVADEGASVEAEINLSLFSRLPETVLGDFADSRNVSVVELHDFYLELSRR